MKFAVIPLAFAVVATASGPSKAVVDRDKTGTSTGLACTDYSQVAAATRLSSTDKLEAESEGFEPSVPLPVHRFSRPAHSTTLATLPVALPEWFTRAGREDIATIAAIPPRRAARRTDHSFCSAAFDCDFGQTRLRGCWFDGSRRLLG